MSYQKLRNNIEDQGFELNHYDPCVANNMIDDAQFAIVRHADDLKLSHENSYEVTKMINHLKLC